jgi:AraC family transcriptional regulator, ethanolamine operon transcriptional activator
MSVPYTTDCPIGETRPRLLRECFSDIDEQATRLLGHNQLYQQISKGPFRGEFWSIFCSDDFSIFIERSNQRLEQSGVVPEGTAAFTFLLNTDSPATLMRRTFGRDEMGMFPGGTRFSATSTPKTSYCVINVSEALLGSESFQAKSFAVSGSARQRYFNTALRSLVLAACETGSTANYTGELDPLALLQQAILSTLRLTLAFPGDRHVEAPSARLRGLYDRAVVYIQHHLGSDLTISRLAKAMSVSERRLQQAFHVEAGVSPAQYIKAVRMNYVRRDIMSTDYLNEPIADIAARWGFWHPSRFGQDYRKMFGCPPSNDRPSEGTDHP